MKIFIVVTMTILILLAVHLLKTKKINIENFSSEWLKKSYLCDFDIDNTEDKDNTLCKKLVHSKNLNNIMVTLLDSTTVLDTRKISNTNNQLFQYNKFSSSPNEIETKNVQF